MKKCRFHTDICPACELVNSNAYMDARLFQGFGWAVLNLNVNEKNSCECYYE